MRDSLVAERERGPRANSLKLPSLIRPSRQTPDVLYLLQQDQKICGAQKSEMLKAFLVLEIVKR